MLVNVKLFDIHIPIRILTYDRWVKKNRVIPESIVWEAKDPCYRVNSIVHGSPDCAEAILVQLPGLIQDYTRAEEEARQGFIEVMEQADE